MLGQEDKPATCSGCELIVTCTKIHYKLILQCRFRRVHFLSEGNLPLTVSVSLALKLLMLA